jgi:hypothetical protein
MKIVISTQHHENYAWNEDGTIGTGVNAYWKAKGGSEIMIEHVESQIKMDDFFGKKCEMIVDSLREKIEEANDYFMVAIVGWSIEDDDYMSWFEKSQLEYDGEITSYEPRIDLDGNPVERDYALNMLELQKQHESLSYYGD